MHVQARAQGALHTVTQFFVLNCDDREGRTTRTTVLRPYHDIVTRGKYLSDRRSSNIGRAFAGYV